MTVSSIQLKRSPWQNVAILTLGFWLSSSLILDWVIMPSLYVSGMMTQAGFTTAGYLIFWNYNRIELLAAALVVTSVLVLNKTQFAGDHWQRGTTILALLLLAVPLLATYFLTPQMSATGVQLNLFESATEVPATMNLLHAGYWVLEAVKFVGGTLLFWRIRK
ncbi:hypothetical protein [Gloeocapsopsis dulcis]|uniref:DUF4149 domain-containing protein n=1 Tax=Gloeocapsopsis dulcis AAB1 = 1H9 TaxID=1433147 RepID=A0A6N8FX85_9CHRO|nr:hypothetical protein [Gloeocapsopsis dulcis]MUL37374.1 hypothetical protein [Gloeocapsopsis dulcis AAB1 = 1H9]WNN88909.1 hypothetical protein P0S91_22020 [Gloeocapsopsis dulcis]